MTRQKLTLEITCSNLVCQKLAVLTGRARKNVLKGQRGYCSTACSVAGQRARLAETHRRLGTRLHSALPSGWTLHDRIPNGFISEAAAVPGGAGSRVFV